MPTTTAFRSFPAASGPPSVHLVQPDGGPRPVVRIGGSAYDAVGGRDEKAADLEGPQRRSDGSLRRGDAATDHHHLANGSGTPPPEGPADRRVALGPALTWAVAMGIGVAVSRMIAVRLSARAWEAATHEAPPEMT